MTKHTPHIMKHPHRLSVRALLTAILILLFVSTSLHWKLCAKYYDHSSAIQLQSIEDDQRQLVIVPSTPSHTSKIILPKYDKAMAAQAITRTDWICGDREPMTPHRPFVSFVHVYKTAGSTLRDFFSKYANLCRKSLMVIVGCTEVNPRILKSGANLDKCRLKYVIDRRRNIIHHDEMPKEDRVYLTVNTTILQNNFDILAGHYRIGMLDNIFSTNMRHIVFLRQPQERYVSSILYRAKNQHSDHKAETVEGTAQYIKENIFKARKKNDYNESIFKYLLTPEQVETMRKKKKGEDKTMEKTRLVIENLVHYNTIVGMTERFSESMLILKHVLLPDEFSSEEREEYANEFFDEYIPSSSDESEEVPRENVSQMGSISTSSVMAELKRDKTFMEQFVEFLKYEQIIVDFALKMHHIQFDLVVDNN